MYRPPLRLHVLPIIGLLFSVGCGGAANTTGDDPDAGGSDSPSIVVTPTEDLTTTEAGGQATFTVALGAEPFADVTVALESSDTSEGTVYPSALTFTVDNWNAPQTVTVTGVDDDLADGTQYYVIYVGPAVSSDGRYDGLEGPEVSVANIDNDTPGVTVAPTTGLVTTEAGGSDFFSVVLNSQPVASVTFGLSSSNTDEGTVSPASLTFTPDNWNAPQTVTVTGVADDIADGDQFYVIFIGPAVSDDPGYDGLIAPEVSVSNTDNDSPGFTVDPTTGLVTTEDGGTDYFTVVLNSQPTADVVILLESSNTDEGIVSPASLTFTPANWHVMRTVTVTGVDDDIADGDQPYTIVSEVQSDDEVYAALTFPTVYVTNEDDDGPGILVWPTTGLATSEFLESDTFEIVLRSAPTSDVTIGLSSSDTSEGTVSPTSVTFTPENWHIPRTITVTGVDDDIADGDQEYTIITAPAISEDPDYNGIDPANVSVTNYDNDSAGIAINPRKKLHVTTESGGTATIRMRLNIEPTASVTCSFESSDPSEGVVSPSSFTFTTANWSVRQNMTVTGVDDDEADGDQLYRIIMHPCTSEDLAYHGLKPRDIQMINLDND